MIKRYHEAPLALFDTVQQLTDGDYALVHLFETNPDYLNKFREAVEKGRDVILDNSIFELGTAFDSVKYAKWIKDLKPTWYIVPDSWKNGQETTRMFFEFFARFPKDTLPGKVIGVAQGNTLEEVAACYEAIEPYCDKIAFNLDFSSWSDIPKSGIPHSLRMSIGRFKMLSDLYERGVINPAKPHHLLGCGVPQEAMWYPKKWTWIDSIDTCNPVISGIEGTTYDDCLPGLVFKSSTKMCEIVNQPVTSAQKKLVVSNIEKMKAFCE